jgi:hypothetical protein
LEEGLLKLQSGLFALLVVLTCGLPRPATAGTVLYTNGPVDGADNAWDITDYGVADSFSISAPSLVTGVTFYTWDLSEEVPDTVDWLITLSAFADPSDPTQTLGSGTAGLTAVYLDTNDDGYDIYSNQLSIPSLDLAAGTYWLQLQNATDMAGDGNPLYWDENDGPSQAWNNAYGPGPIDPDTTLGACASPGDSGDCSESFQITGDASGVPEPGSLALVVAGLFVATLLRRTRGR